MHGHHRLSTRSLLARWPCVCVCTLLLSFSHTNGTRRRHRDGHTQQRPLERVCVGRRLHSIRARAVARARVSPAAGNTAPPSKMRRSLWHAEEVTAPPPAAPPPRAPTAHRAGRAGSVAAAVRRGGPSMSMVCSQSVDAMTPLCDERERSVREETTGGCCMVRAHCGGSLLSAVVVLNVVLPGSRNNQRVHFGCMCCVGGTAPKRAGASGPHTRADAVPGRARAFRRVRPQEACRRGHPARLPHPASLARVRVSTQMLACRARMRAVSLSVSPLPPKGTLRATGAPVIARSLIFARRKTK